MRAITTHNPEGKPGQLEIVAVDEPREGVNNEYLVENQELSTTWTFRFGRNLTDAALIAILHDREMSRILGKSREGGDEAPELLQRLLEIFVKRGAG